MMLDAAFFDRLSRLRLAMGHRTSMNLTGNRKSTQKGSSMEFSDFREYMPGDDIRRIDWNAYGRLDRLYVKEYMEEKEAVVSILIDTSASMNYGAKKKSELACMLAAAFSYMGLNNMDRVLLYDMHRMQRPFVMEGGKRVLPRMADWLEQCAFEGTVDIARAIWELPVKGPGLTILVSDFLQEAFLDQEQETLVRLLRFLNYRKQRTVLLHVLAKEELSVELTGTRNLIDMEDQSTLRVTLDDGSIRTYEKSLQDFTDRMRRECARAGAFYGVCSTGTDIYQLIFQDLRMLYDI
ncbi:MAG: DUF58 domain-containing protein [Lachnospiraceae bacterium]|nr:DUF58 domain-containing protein [Lachnospiraceae bacterium]